jgi:hypothetical protein
MNNKESVLKKLKSVTNIKSLKLPANINFEEAEGVVSIILDAKEDKTPQGVVANMQQDASAFEGWVICMKAAVPEWTFQLDWTVPKNKANGHYQRFLYRVSNFQKYYGDWFSIADGRKIDLEALQIRENEKYALNAPTNSDNRINNADHSPENFIENTIIKNQPCELRGMFNIATLRRQLPVGVFRKSVNRENAIFTHGKSAVDIWGISANDLVIFELKAPGNEKIGVISELFFYAMVMKDEQEGKFVRDHSWGTDIQSTTTLKAMVLAENLHPFIGRRVFEILTNPFKGRIQFGYIKTPVNFGFKKMY